MSRQFGEHDFYSIYDFQKQETIEFFKTQRTDEFNNWQVFRTFYVHPDGPKVSDDLWALISHEFAHQTWYHWASVETMNSAFFDDSIKFYANFYFSNWNLLNEFTAIQVNYRQCVAKAFVKRWPEQDGNPLAFLRDEFEEFTKYVEKDFKYEGKKWIDEQKSSILSELSDIPTTIQLTDPSAVYFPEKNDEIKAAYTCYRTYDGWFGYVFKPYCENPIKKEGDTWMYHDGHGYVPVEYVSKYVESVPNKIDVAQATEHYISELDLTDFNSIESFKMKCLNLVEFYKFRELLMEITQVDQEESYYSYHCDRYLNTELKKIMDWLDVINECFLRINSYVDELSDEKQINFREVFGWTYLIIEQFKPETIGAIHSMFYNDKGEWYPGRQGEEYASDRNVLWLTLLGLFSGTDEADTFLVSMENYYERGLRYMNLPETLNDTTPNDLVLHKQGEHEINATSNTYGFTISGIYYWVEEQEVNHTLLALIIRWFVRNYTKNGIPIIGNLLAETAQKATELSSIFNLDVKPIFLLKADWDVLKPWLGNESKPLNMLDLFRTRSIPLDSDIYVDENINAFYEFFHKKDVDHKLRELCANNYTSYQVRTTTGMPDYVLKAGIADLNNLLLVIGGTHNEITEPHTLDSREFVDLAGLNADSYISEITDKKFYVTSTNNSEWLYKMITFNVNNVLLPILEVNIGDLLVDVPDMPRVSSMTRESYESWLRECQLIDLTLAKTVKMYADYCTTKLTSIVVNGNSYQIYGCECYTAQAISNIIKLANKLVDNEQKMYWSFIMAIESRLQDKYYNMYVNPPIPQDLFFKYVSLNRLIYDGEVISYNSKFYNPEDQTNIIDRINNEIPRILDEDDYYKNVSSSLIESSKRKSRWESLQTKLEELISLMTATPMYITDIRQYQKYPSVFNWIQKFRLVNEDSDTIAMLHNKLDSNTPGIRSIITSIAETYEIKQN